MKITNIETFQLVMGNGQGWMPRGAFVRVDTDESLFGLGEASPMLGGFSSLNLISREMSPYLVGKDALDASVLLDTLHHKCIKLGPEGIVTAALAALDIALWDLRGKLFGHPIFKLLGGAWRTSFTCYSSVGHGAGKTVDQVVRDVERRVEREQPAAVKLRLDGDRTRQDVDIKTDIEKAKALRRLLGDEFPIAFDANNAYSIGGAIRVGRALEELNYVWFEEPVQHYNISAMGEVSKRLDITVSAGEQTYTIQGLKDLISAGVRMLQPDVIKMGGISGMMKCAALASAHGVELVPHQTQPAVGHLANMHFVATLIHQSKPLELADDWERASPIFKNPSEPHNGEFNLPSAPGLGLEFDSSEMERRKIPVTA